MMVKLDDVVRIEASSKSVVGDKFWLLNLDMVEQQTGNVLSYNYVGKDALNGSIIQFDTDCVLYSKLRPNLNKVVLPKQDGFATSEMLPLRPDAKTLTREYLTTFLRSESFVAWAVSKTAGAKMPRLGSKELLSKEIPLPSLSEQERISKQFAKIAELIALRKEQLAKLDELVKARFVELFGDPEHNEKQWNVFKLDALCSVSSSKRIYQNELSVEGVPFLRISDLVNRMDTGSTECELYIPEERYEELKTLGLVPVAGDMLITARGTLGRCYTLTESDRFYFQDGMITWLYDFDKALTTNYLTHLFAMSGFRKQIDSLQAGSTVAYLSISMTKKLDVMLPPLELQNQFAAFVKQTDKSKLAIQQSLDKLETLKKSLMQKYFG